MNPWTVIVAERGFIYVGRTHREGDQIIIESAYGIRRFSLQTQDGLGGLATRAPQKDNDILDPTPTVRIYVFGVIATIDCPDQEAWSNWHAAQSKAPKKGAES